MWQTVQALIRSRHLLGQSLLFRYKYCGNEIDLYIGDNVYRANYYFKIDITVKCLCYGTGLTKLCRPRSDCSKNHSDQDLHCCPFQLQFLDVSLHDKPELLRFLINHNSYRRRHSRVVRDARLCCRKSSEGREFEPGLHHPTTGTLSVNLH